MNVIAQLEYELAYYDPVVHRFNHYTTRTPPVSVVVSVEISWRYYFQNTPLTSMSYSFLFMIRMHSQWCWLYGKMVFCSWKLALSISVMLSVIISVEINWSHNFESKLHILTKFQYHSLQAVIIAFIYICILFMYILDVSKNRISFKMNWMSQKNWYHFVIS